MHFIRQSSVLVCLSSRVLHWKTLTCPVVRCRQKKDVQADKVISCCTHAYITSIASNHTVVLRDRLKGVHSEIKGGARPQKEQKFPGCPLPKGPTDFPN